MGVAHKELASRLHATGKYEVGSFGWFWHSAQARKLRWDYPWKQFTNSNTQQPYGHPAHWPDSSKQDFQDSAFYQVVEDMFRPHVIIGMGDYWMLDYIYKMPNRCKFKFIHEVPIDGEPIPAHWVRDMKQADALISMSQFGKRVIRDQDKHCDVEVIPRGIEPSVFFPIKAPKDQIRKEAMSSALGRFVVGVFDRFQDRKQIGRAIEAFAKFIADGKHPGCDLYLHMDINDPFSTAQKKTLDGEWGLVARYGIRDRVIINHQLTVERGVPERDMNLLYNCCDVKLSTTQGEGWGLTTAEAMACGIPNVATNYSTMPELLGEGGRRGLLTDVQAYVTGMYNIERALVDTTHAARLLDTLYRSPTLREQIGEEGRAFISQFKWDTIIKRWEKLIDDVVAPKKYNLISMNALEPFTTNDINIYGAVKENTGWAITTRGIAEALDKRDWNVSITEGGGSNANFALSPKLTEMMSKEQSRQVALINHLPEHAFKTAQDCTARSKLIYFPYELDHMPYDVVGCLNRHSDVYLCPTTFV
jgi:glycosyltransferase involved in cell wall biosynthesis